MGSDEKLKPEGESVGEVLTAWASLLKQKEEFEKQENRDKEKIREISKESDRKFQQFLDLKAKILKEEGVPYYGVYDFRRLEADRLGLNEDAYMIEVLRRIQDSELALKASLTSTNPRFLEKISTDPTEWKNTNRVEVLKNACPFAVTIPLQNIEMQLEKDGDFKQRLIKEFGCGEESSNQDIIQTVREFVRLKVFKEIVANKGIPWSTANYHVTGACETPQETVGALSNAISQAIAKIYGENWQQYCEKNDLNPRKDISAAYSEDENFKVGVEYVNLSREEVEAESKLIVTTLEGTEDDINTCGSNTRGVGISLVNNACTEVSTNVMAKGGISSLLVKVVPPLEGGQPEKGYVKVVERRKGTSYSVGKVELEPNYIHPTSKPSIYLDVNQMRGIQKNALDAFAPPPLVQHHIEELLSQDPPNYAEIDKIAFGEGELVKMGFSVAYLDITGYSKLVEELRRLRQDPDSIFEPLIKKFVKIARNIGALSDNWAGDSIKFMILDKKALEEAGFRLDGGYPLEAVGDLPREAKSTILACSMYKAHKEFVEEQEKISKEGNSSFPEIINTLQTQLQEIRGLRSKISNLGDNSSELKNMEDALGQAMIKRRDLVVNIISLIEKAGMGSKDEAKIKRAMSFVLAKTLVAEVKNYGMKGISTRSRCISQQTGVGVDANGDINLEPGSEVFVTQNFDKQAKELENATQGTDFILGEEEFNRLPQDFKDLYVRVEMDGKSAYKLNLEKAFDNQGISVLVEQVLGGEKQKP